MTYLRPVDPTGICSYYTHNHRTTPSSEAGVDYYCPIGTPIRAAADGVVFDVAGGIAPATGRYVTIDLDDGHRVRYLHLSRWNAYKGQRVVAGQIIGYSGASGYGSEYFGAPSLATIPANTGGPHVHTTLWAGHYYQFGRYPLEPTLDFERYTGGSAAGSNTSPFNPAEEALIVNADDKNWLNGLGQSIIDQINAGPLRADLNTVNQAVQAVRADLNYVHQLSPYSLKAILEGVRGGSVSLTTEQVAAISGQLTASAVFGLEAALKDDFDGLKALIAKQPPEFVAALKSAL